MNKCHSHEIICYVTNMGLVCNCTLFCNNWIAKYFEEQFYMLYLNPTGRGLNSVVFFQDYYN